MNNSSYSSAGVITLPLKRIHIELTNICNFDCTFCPKFKMERPYGFMEASLAKKAIDEIAEKRLAEKITFHVMGEPFMHKEFFDILHHAKKRGLPVGITNNGTYLNEEIAEKVVEAGVEQVNISLQTPNEKAYKTRVPRGTHFETYRKNILSFLKRCYELNRTMKLKLHFLNTTYAGNIEKIVGELPVMKGKEEIRENLSRWGEMICDKIEYPIEERGKMRSVLSSLSAHQWNVIEIVPGIFFETYILNSWGDALRDEAKVQETSFGFCSALADHFAILWDGRITFCCKDFDGKTESGFNIKENSLEEFLLSSTVQDVVKGFQKYRVIHPQCKKCLGGTSLAGSMLGTLSSIFIWKFLKPYFYKEISCVSSSRR